MGIILFAISFGAHAYQVFRYRVWSFLPFSLACLMEIIGYIFRTLSSVQDPYLVTDFVVQYFFIVVAPVFISASIYVCLSKLIRLAGAEGFDVQSHFLLRPKVLLWVFITADVVTTIIQVAGAALIGVAESNGDSPKTANNILLAGLAIQTGAFLIFLVLYGMFALLLSRDAKIQGHFKSKRPFMLATGVVSILVLLRTVFRLAETSEGVFGYAGSHEVFFGCLEYAPIVVAVWIMAIWHPGRWLPKRTPRGSSPMVQTETTQV